MALNVSSKILAATVLTAAAAWIIAPTTAAPISSSMGLQNTVPMSVETVQYRRGWRRGGGIGAGIVAGAIIGGAIASRPYGYYGYDGYGPGYAYAPAYGQGYAGGDEILYCQQRFRSYDPNSGTYLGFDGYRHPCP